MVARGIAAVPYHAYRALYPSPVIGSDSVSFVRTFFRAVGLTTARQDGTTNSFASWLFGCCILSPRGQGPKKWIRGRRGLNFTTE